MKYILGVLGVIFIVVFAIILMSRGKGGEKAPQGQQGNRTVKVAEQNKEGTSMQLTVQGRLVGEDKRRAVRITITQNERRMDILTGYEEAVERSQVYPNTPAAYEHFLLALDRAGFSRSRPSTIKDERAICPTGQRYIFEVKEYSQELSRLWRTSCSSKQGTLGGASSSIRALFRAQIPDYSKQMRGVNL